MRMNQESERWEGWCVKIEEFNKTHNYNERRKTHNIESPLKELFMNFILI